MLICRCRQNTSLGAVSNEGATDGNFALSLFSYIMTDIDANDMVTVSQKVSLWDKKHIFFDIKLNTSSGIWNPKNSQQQYFSMIKLFGNRINPMPIILGNLSTS